LGCSTSGDHKRIVVFGPNLGKGGVECEIVSALFVVGFAVGRLRTPVCRGATRRSVIDSGGHRVRSRLSDPPALK
jgi:hypothetical protein